MDVTYFQSSRGLSQTLGNPASSSCSNRTPHWCQDGGHDLAQRVHATTTCARQNIHHAMCPRCIPDVGNASYAYVALTLIRSRAIELRGLVAWVVPRRRVIYGVCGDFRDVNGACVRAILIRVLHDGACNVVTAVLDDARTQGRLLASCHKPAEYTLIEQAPRVFLAGPYNINLRITKPRKPHIRVAERQPEAAPSRGS